LYFARTALAEQSRLALYERRFPFFEEGLFALPLHEFLSTLCTKLIILLQETKFQPYAKTLNPHRGWVNAGVVYRIDQRNISCIQDLVLFASSLHFFDEACLLNPMAADKKHMGSLF